ncbi:MAG TPA: hypothetical protein PLB35_04995 [Myxococcota bacterium]|nr:hypothetical protein [Myxococcota bacterium]HOH76591.1 hypothetical protein [Myxococcota bacterium]
MKSVIFPIHPFVLAFAISFASGCGDTGPGLPDAGHDVVAPEDVNAPDDVINPGDVPLEPDGVEQPAPEGRVLVAVTGWGGDYGTEAWVNADFYDAPMRMDAFSAYSPGMYQVAARKGDCVLYTASTAACEPACDWDRYCVAGNRCLVHPSRLSAGKLTVKAGSATISADPSGDEWMPNYYYFEGQIPTSQLDATKTLSVTAEGADGGYAAFDVSQPGFDGIEFVNDLDNNAFELKDDQDFLLEWTAPSGDLLNLFVEVVINVGWHGSPPESVLYCRKGAVTGSLTIAKEVIAQLPVIGGIALMQHGSHVGLVRNVVTDVAGKRFDFTVTRRHGINPAHNAPEF